MRSFDDDTISESGLRLGLGIGLDEQNKQRPKGEKKNTEDPCNYKPKPFLISLSLGSPPPSDEICFHHQHVSSPSTVVSSFSNSSSSIIKRERDQFGAGEELLLDLEVENILIPSNVVDVNRESGRSNSCRKKLRLNKQQSAILEDNFKQHSTLNPNQKQELARKLNLRTRQVEVWFQNRRARTKLKQTEVDYELLKKCCETLREENKRLQKELQELKSMKSRAHGGPFYLQLPVANLSMMCPSCERIFCGGNNIGSTNGSSPPPMTALIIGSKSTQHHLYNNNYQFTQSSHLVSLEG